MIYAGTGHRPNKLGGYSQRTFDLLVELASYVLERDRPELVISGMALGWDQALAAAAAQLGIMWIAAVPFAGQESNWPQESQDEYLSILRTATEIITVSEGGYTPAKMHVRDHWMVDSCSDVLALYNGDKKGGTYQTVKYARSMNTPIINLWDTWVGIYNV